MLHVMFSCFASNFKGWGSKFIRGTARALCADHRCWVRLTKLWNFAVGKSNKLAKGVWSLCTHERAQVTSSFASCPKGVVVSTSTHWLNLNFPLTRLCQILEGIFSVKNFRSASCWSKCKSSIGHKSSCSFWTSNELVSAAVLNDFHDHPVALLFLA